MEQQQQWQQQQQQQQQRRRQQQLTQQQQVGCQVGVRGVMATTCGKNLLLVPRGQPRDLHSMKSLLRSAIAGRQCCLWPKRRPAATEVCAMQCSCSMRRHSRMPLLWCLSHCTPAGRLRCWCSRRRPVASQVFSFHVQSAMLCRCLAGCQEAALSVAKAQASRG
jgi:hypothetical protein